MTTRAAGGGGGGAGEWAAVVFGMRPSGKGQLTTTYQWFLARWARRLSWSEVAECFQTTWDKVAQSVAMVVAWGLAHRDLTGVKAIGVDEIQWRLGHKYLTVVYQIDEGAKRLLWVGKDRTIETLTEFFESFGAKRAAQLQFVCSDMWRPLSESNRRAG